MSDEKERNMETNGDQEEKIVAKEKDETAIISFPEKGELDIEQEIQKLEKNVELFNRVKIVSLKLTKESDWVMQGKEPYLMDRGAENIAIAWGIDILPGMELKLEWAEDEKGRYYSYVAKGQAYSKRLGRTVSDIGVCSQRDRFFGMVRGEMKPMEEVDMANIRRKAVTNLYNRLIKRCVGLSGVTVDDLQQAGLDTSKIAGISYSNGAQKAKARLSTEGKEVQDKLGDMLMMMANEDKAEAAKLLEKYSAFRNDKGETISAKSLKQMSEKWLQSTYGKAKADFEKTQGGGDE